MADDLPTIAEIKAATAVLSSPDASAKVVRVRDKFAVKFGTRVTFQEGETLKYISNNTAVCTPRVHAIFSEPETEFKYIVMDFIEGQTLQDMWPSLTAADKATISTQLQHAMAELRSLTHLPSI